MRAGMSGFLGTLDEFPVFSLNGYASLPLFMNGLIKILIDISRNFPETTISCWAANAATTSGGSLYFFWTNGELNTNMVSQPPARSRV